MEPQIEKAVSLFAFLADLQKRSEKPVKETKDYGPKKHRVWFHDLKELVQQRGKYLTLTAPLRALLGLSAGNAGAESGDAAANVLLKIERLEKESAPAPGAEVERWLDGGIDNPLKRPQVREEVTVGVETSAYEELDATVTQAIEQWLQLWDEWALDERVRDLYDQLFDIQTDANQNSEEYELVFGFGNLHWMAPNRDKINRHLFVAKLEIEHSPRNGSLTVTLEDAPAKAELNALPPDALDDISFIEETKRAVAEFEGEVVDVNDLTELLRTTANRLHRQAVYRPSAEIMAGDGHPVLTYAPAMILRKRVKVGLGSFFEQIARAIAETGTVPRSLWELVEMPVEESPEERLREDHIADRGGVLRIDGEIFSPLPLNDKQKQVLARVDSNAQTIVQGPPGTGKTHMAAALLSHLLAQGKRVLVTAQKARALYELRDKLPAEIRELAVSVIDSSKKDMSELEVAVSTIARKADNFDAAQNVRDLERLSNELDQLREQRQRLGQTWSKRLEREFTDFGVAGYPDKFSEAALRTQEETDDYSWIQQLNDASFTEPFPLNSGEINEWFTLLDDASLAGARGNEDELDVISLGLPEPAQWEALVADLEQSRGALGTLESELPAWATELAKLDESTRASREAKLNELKELEEKIQGFHQDWADDVTRDFAQDGGQRSVSTASFLAGKISTFQKERLTDGSLARVSANGSLEQFTAMARSLQEYLSGGGTVKTRADGSVKIGFFTSSVVKESEPFFSHVRVDGLPPTSLEAVQTFLDYVSLRWVVSELVEAWAPLARIQDASLELRMGNIQREVNNLTSLVDLHQQRATNYRQLKDRGLVSADGKPYDLAVVRQHRATEKELNQRIKDLEAQVQEVEDALASPADKAGASQNLRDLYAAAKARSAEGYSTAMGELVRVAGEAPRARRRNELSAAVKEWSFKLTSLVSDAETASEWRPRVFILDDARAWALAAQRLAATEDIDFVQLQEELSFIDQRITDIAVEIAALRAWDKAVGHGRINRQTRTDMMDYTQRVRKLGKGMGKDSERNRRAVRKSLERCSAAVPVWIMPIYKVVEQFQLKENMFDVVIVDEASQAGVEAVFLQYLAEKIVVIGDDQQVSPMSVGSLTDEVYELARQHIKDFRYFDSWTNQDQSLFGAAQMYYQDRIVLDEHRRCVPEIIEFSNKLAYRPNNIELTPVRQVPPGERLAPFKVTRTPNAFSESSGRAQVNRAEALVLIDRLKRCLDNPRYDGMTMGVISLLTSAPQIKFIRARLQEELPPEIWEERELVVGGPADFQGAERDVIFLTMVSTAQVQENGQLTPKRVATLSGKEYVQRYNVAVSRAKDQVWLFHSIGTDQLHSNEDVRWQLLEHAYAVAEADPEVSYSELVSGDQRCEPFDSLFEQRVYNRIAQRGFRVIPQYQSAHYYIDLVVEGAGGRLAVECDGDHWHGPAQAKEDQGRQHELERLGWHFVRIFESDFYLNPDEQMQRVFDELDSRGITPFSSANQAKKSNTVEVIEEAFRLLETGEVPGGSGVMDEPVSPQGSPEPAPREDQRLPDGEPKDTSEPAPLSGSGTSAGKQGEEAGQGENDGPFDAVYSKFSGRVYPYDPDLDKPVPVKKISVGIRAIVEHEGPITGELICYRYRQANGQRVTRASRTALTKALSDLLRKKSIHVAETAGTARYKDRTFYLEGQDLACVRTRGDRDFDVIPFEERAELMRRVFELTGKSQREDLMRETMKYWEQQRLTAKVREALDEPYNWLRKQGVF